MRFAIKGLRAGETVHVGGRFVATHPLDGGAKFSKAQVDELGKRGYKLQRVDDEAPTPDPAPDQEALDKLDAQRKEADANAAAANKAPDKK